MTLVSGNTLCVSHTQKPPSTICDLLNFVDAIEVGPKHCQVKKIEQQQIADI